MATSLLKCKNFVWEFTGPIWNQMEYLKEQFTTSSMLQKYVSKDKKKRLIRDGAIAFIIQSHKCLIPLTGGNSTLRDNKQTMIILI